MDKLFPGTKSCGSPNLGLHVAEGFAPKIGRVAEADWHREALFPACMEIGGVRPEVLQS